MKKLFLILFILYNSLISKELDKVSLQLKGKYQFQFAGFLVSKEKGFYKDIGLDVDIKEFNNKIDIIDDVKSKKVDFAIGDSSLIYNALNGENITALMAIFQQTPLILLGIKSHGIKTLNDIQDKKIALYTGIDSISIEAMLKTNNIKYISKEIDLITAYISHEPYIAKMKGLKIVTFTPKDYGFEWYGDILFTSQNMVRSNPRLVQKMYEASQKGWNYAFANIDEVVDLIYTKYNSLDKTKDALKYEAVTLKKLSGYGENFGEINIEKTKEIAQQINLIKEENHKLNTLDNFVYKVPKEDKTLNINLTKDEIKYLKNKKEIKMCVDPDWLPLEKIDKDGNYIGILSEYIKLFSSKLDITFILEKTKTYKQSRQYLKSGKCDIIVGDVATKTVKEQFITTKPYFIMPRAFAIHSDTKGVQNFSQIALDGKIGVLLNGPVESILRNIYSDIDIVTFSNMNQGLNAVALKQVIAYVGAMPSIAYKIQHNGLLNVDIGGTINEDYLSILINKNKSQLVSIFDKTIDTISQNDKSRILNKWIKVTYKKGIDYTLIWQLLSIFTIIFIIILIAYLKQKKLHTKIKILNDSLENKVKIEVEKNKQQQLLMLHQSRLDQMGEMISMIAHQWRQPLNSLSMLNQSIILKYNRDKVDKEFIEYFKLNSKKQIHNMSKTIDDFRDFFKPEKEKVEFIINNIINDTIDIIKTIFLKNNINIIFNSIENFKTIGYPNELGQAILNIINNAKDALVDNDIKNKWIKITLKKDDKNIILTISDNARGIPSDIKDKIFDPYFSTKEEKNGTGIGLYMTKIIIEDHMGGELSVLNDENGAVFRIKL